MRRKNYSAIGHSTYNFIFSAGYLFALIYGCVMILDKTLTYGALSAILQLVNNVQVPFMSLSNVMPKYYATVASAERLMEIEEIESEKNRKYLDAVKTYEKLNGIIVRDLTFTYDRDKVLDDASFYINKGDFIMIEGSSGVGKSTLIKLMLGVYNTDSGEILLDLEGEQVPIDSSCRTLFSFVPQGNMIFSGTLKDNVTFINDLASEEEINKALEVSCASDFIKELPSGLDTVVGENGVGLSEGQIQRIAIARAVLCNAPIILLDEATSALDELTEKRVLHNLRELKDITLIIISHKKAAANICNRRIKIENKKILEE
jgi:ATP-binding cassette subfamily B protein